jgi:hypothetical protein
MMQMPKPGWRPIVVALAAVVALTAPALAAPYRFVVVADHERDHFNQGSFACATINKHGEVAFKAARTASDGVNFFDGTYRANTNGTITAIVEDPDRAQFTLTSNFTSITAQGDVALGSILAGDPSFNVILRGDGRIVNQVTTIASTAGTLGFVNFNLSMNTHGEVAFMGGLAPSFSGPRGLFSGTGGPVTIHYLDNADIVLDGHPARFLGFAERPSINTHGDIAVSEFLQSDFQPGIFVGQQGRFRTIISAAPFTEQFGQPVLNDKGTVGFQRHFFNNGTFVSAIVTSNGGALTTLASTASGYGFFTAGPAINSQAEVAFAAITADFTLDGIFTGPDPVADRVVVSGDAIGAGTVASSSIQFCEGGINDAGEVAFITTLDDPTAQFGVRFVVVRAEPLKWKQ